MTHKPLNSLSPAHQARIAIKKDDPHGLRNVEPLIEMALALKVQGIDKKDSRGRNSRDYSFNALRILEQAAMAARKRGDFIGEVTHLEYHLQARERLHGVSSYVYGPLIEALERLVADCEARGMDWETMRRVYRRQAKVYGLAAEGDNPVAAADHLKEQAIALGKAGDENEKISVLWKLAAQYRSSAEEDEGRFKEDAPLLPQVFSGFPERPSDIFLQFSVPRYILVRGSGPQRPEEQNFAQRIHQDLLRIIENRTGEIEALGQILQMKGASADSIKDASLKKKGANAELGTARGFLEELQIWMKTQPWYVEKKPAPS